MKSNLKDRIVVSLIVVVFLVTVLGLVYALFSKPKVTYIYTPPTMIVESSNLNQIDRYEKRNTVYAVKDQGSLKYHYLEGSETLLVLEATEYNKLVEGKTYWFGIKLTKAGDPSSGVIKSVYTENIMR